MNLPRYATAAAQLLRRHVENTPLTGAERTRGVRTVERAMLVRARRRGWLWGVGAVAGVAAVFLLFRAFVPALPGAHTSGLVEVSPLGNGATLRNHGRVVPLVGQTPVGAGATIETASTGGAALQSSSRSLLMLERATAVRVEGDAMTERFALERGALSAHVEKLGAGQRFIVDTPDAEVEVRGTRFVLRVLETAQACGSGSRTRLEVSEGVVEVRAAGQVSRVTVGQSWPVGCASAEASPEPASSASVAASIERAGSARSVGRAASQVAVPSGTSALTQQNDLFAAGVALRRQGDVAGALRAYQDLISQFPSSPLAQNAMVERMRLLASSQRLLAKEEARRYLRAYPRGFAFEEAQRLTDEP